MKRHGALFPRILAFANLLAAARRASRGKHRRADVAAFHFALEPELLALQRELADGSYRPGSYRAYRIREPKPRLISAAPYRDRVVHHALMQVLEPIFERGFIADSYATRRGKGTHRALDRCTGFARRFRYVLKCDLEKYFPSIDHGILMARLARRVKCAPTLALLDRIIAASNPQEPVLHYFPGDDLLTPLERRRGIPIGNLTSQFFGNLMLDPLDHYLKETWRVRGYLRYMDDFLVFGDDKRQLHEVLAACRAFLAAYRLRLHPRKCAVMRTADGVPFLGWQVYPTHRRIRRATGVRFQRRLKALQVAYAAGEVDLPAVRARLLSWIGHLAHGDTWGLRGRLLESCVLRRDE